MQNRKGYSRTPLNLLCYVFLSFHSCIRISQFHLAQSKKIKKEKAKQERIFPNPDSTPVCIFFYFTHTNFTISFSTIKKDQEKAKQERYSRTPIQLLHVFSLISLIQISQSHLAQLKKIKKEKAKQERIFPNPDSTPAHIFFHLTHTNFTISFSIIRNSRNRIIPEAK